MPRQIYFLRKIKLLVFLFFLTMTGVCLTGCLVIKSDIVENSSIKLTQKSNYQNNKNSFQSAWFTQDANQLLVENYTGVFTLDVNSGKKVYEFKHDEITKHVVLSNSEKYLLITYSKGAALWDFNSRQLVKQWNIAVDLFGAISTNEKWLLVGNNIVNLESLQTMARLDAKSSHNIPVFSYDNNYLLVSSFTKTQLYDVNKQAVKSEWRIGSLGAEGFFTHDSKYLLLVHGDSIGIFGPDTKKETISIIDTQTSKSIFSIEASDHITAHTFDSKNQHLFVATKDGTITRWDLTTQKMLNKWVSNSNSRVTALAADKIGNVWVSFQNGEIMVYAAKTQQLIKVFTVPRYITSLAVSQDGTVLSVIRSMDGGISRVIIFDVSYR